LDHHYTFFGAQFRGLRPRLPSASHTVSRRSHFGLATDPVANRWSGGIDRLLPTHPLGNNDEFQGVSPLFQRPELFSARPVIWFGIVMVPSADSSASGLPADLSHSAPNTSPTAVPSQ